MVRGLEAKEWCSLLKFVTSCSWAPLLGFRHLQPAFTILKVHTIEAFLSFHLLGKFWSIRWGEQQFVSVHQGVGWIRITTIIVICILYKLFIWTLSWICLQLVTLHTNVGDIKYEVFCYDVPKTVEVWGCTPSPLLKPSEVEFFFFIIFAPQLHVHQCQMKNQQCFSKHFYWVCICIFLKNMHVVVLHKNVFLSDYGELFADTNWGGQLLILLRSNSIGSPFVQVPWQDYNI